MDRYKDYIPVYRKELNKAKKIPMETTTYHKRIQLILDEHTINSKYYLQYKLESKA